VHRGYVKVWRKIEDSGLIQLPNTLALFMYLLLNATHKDRKMGTPIGVITLKRGQFMSGRIELAARLKQTEQQIRTSLDRLKILEIITIESTSKFSVYTIENYPLYQDDITPNNQQGNQQTTSEQPAGNQQVTTKQECNHLSIKEDKHISRKNALDENFVSFWTAYPKKVGKEAARKAWAKAKPPIADVLKALGWQIKSDQWFKNKGEFIPNPATYINQGRWQDEPLKQLSNAPAFVPTKKEPVKPVDPERLEVHRAAARAASRGKAH
jgi:hypothetical protein